VHDACDVAAPVPNEDAPWNPIAARTDFMQHVLFPTFFLVVRFPGLLTD
jgi:hypothetical protein